MNFIKKEFTLSAFIILTAFAVASAVFFYSSGLPEVTGYAVVSEPNSWVDETGTGLSAPACGSSAGSFGSCSGTAPVLEMRWTDAFFPAGFAELAIKGGVWGTRVNSPCSNFVHNDSTGIGSCTFNNSNLAVGTSYDYWLLLDGHEVNRGILSTPASCLAVTPTPTPTLTPTPTPTPTPILTPTPPPPGSVALWAIPSSVIRNIGSINVTWTFGAGDSCSLLDWIGLYPVSAQNEDVNPSVDYASGFCDPTGLLSSNVTGVSSFGTNQPPGDYLFLYLRGGGAPPYTRMGDSNIVTILPPTQCSDGVDNDSDGTFDHSSLNSVNPDPGCSSTSDDDETNTIITQCNDGLDNDGDVVFDHSSINSVNPDPGCSTPLDDDETNAIITQCSDGVDNDSDGTFDHSSLNSVNPDPGCSSTSDDDETNTINTAPSVNAGNNLTVTESTSQNIVGVTISDVDNNTLTFSWICNGGGVTPVSGSDSPPYGISATYNAPAVSADTPYQCTLTVDDGNGGTASDNVSILVINQVVGTNLIGSETGITGTVSTGASLRFNGFVRAQGGSGTPDTAPSTARICVDGTAASCYSNTSTNLGEFAIPSLPRNTNSLPFQSNSWIMPPGAGLHFFYVCADVYNTNDEGASDGAANNCDQSAAFRNMQCGNTIDDDADGKTDFNGAIPDTGCSSVTDDSEADTKCSDGIDNDSDGFCDFAGCLGLPPDPICTSPAGDNETAECQDSADNDGDGATKVDTSDPGCHTDGNPNNPASYDPNDNDESNTIFKEVFKPFDNFMAMLFSVFR